jgi:hypothetical protein
MPTKNGSSDPPVLRLKNKLQDLQQSYIDQLTALGIEMDVANENCEDPELQHLHRITLNAARRTNEECAALAARPLTRLRSVK